MRKKIFTLIGCLAAIAVLQVSFAPLFAALMGGAEKVNTQSIVKKADSGVFFINLGDYAKGDGSDETDAIQAAFDALVPLKAGWQPHLDGYPHRDLAGVLYIPTPQKFYGISRTINVYEKWNVVIQAETPGVGKQYFHWLGPDEGTMFEFSACMGIRVENLSMNGRKKQVIGLRIGPENQQAGFFKESSFTNLNICDVAVGMKLGDFPNNGPDIAHNSYRDVFVGFSQYGIMARSGNLANNTIMNLNLAATDGAIEGIRMEGGELLVLHSCLGGGPSNTKGAAIGVYSGGIQVIASWSEWKGPLLYGYTAAPEAGKLTSSTVRYPTILMGVTHYGPFMSGEEAPESENPVPLSIIWDRPTPLSLLGSAFWGGVKLGADSQAMIIDQGTTFLNRDGLRFLGEGIERYGRIIHLGTIHPDNPRVLEPYMVDRRNTPGTASPSTGVWKKGDRILNTDPDPSVPAKAWAGWICIKAGEPGIWRPFGAIGE